jgi:NodT family efflux transporter outer membrane factor (OMF) lipoprotein
MTPEEGGPAMKPRSEEVYGVCRHDSRQHAVPGRPAALAGTLAVCLVLALAGCAVGPKYVKPDAKLNDSWSEKADARLSAEAPADSLWWRAFGDTTLDRLIQLAYRQNLPLEIAGVRIMEARAQLGIAVGRQWPQFQVAFGSVTAVGNSQHGVTGALLDHNYSDYQVGFDASWELDFWKQLRKGVRAEAATYLATVADYDNALVSLTAEVARTYAVIRTFEVLIAQAQENARLQEDGLRIAESRYRNGATSELDVTQATTLLEGTRSTIPQLQIGLAQSQNALCTLLGQPTVTLQTLMSGSSGIPSAPAQVAVSIPAEMLRRRPDIRGVELQAIAQCDRVGIAKADLYPRFSLFGTVGTQSTSGAGALSGNSTFSNLFGAGSLFYAIGPRIIWPLFNYGRIKNNERVQDARLQQLLVSYDNTVLQAAQEVEDGLAGYLRSQEAAGYAQNAASAAQRSVDIALVQYREGAVDYQRVLDAERSLLQEQNGLAQTRSSIATNLIALYKALGGGWEMRRGQPFVSDSTRVEMQNRTNWGDYFMKPPSQASPSYSPPTP